MILDKKKIFDVLNSFRHLELSGDSYNPDKPSRGGNEKKCFFISLIDKNHVEILWDKNQLLVYGVQFNLQVVNNGLVKVLVKQEEISKDFSILLNNKFHSMEKRVMAKIDNETDTVSKTEESIKKVKP